MTPVYLDYNATTPVDPAVLAAMLPFLRDQFGNPSSSHALGRAARAAVETARADVAALIGANPDEITFTGGGTEASNMAIRGAAKSNGGRRAIVTTTIEHPATAECCALLEQDGFEIRRIAPNDDGVAAAQEVIAAIDDSVALVTVIHAQNEIGTIQPIAPIAKAAKKHGALVHIDAAQSVGKIAVDVNRLGVDLLSIAGHKLYAPKGIGALYIRRGVALPPLLVGGGQEHGRRPGTENTACIVGLGTACTIAGERREAETERLRALTDRLMAGLERTIPGIRLVGENADRLPNTLNVLFPGVSGRVLLEHCPRVMASTGSACHADREDPSAILLQLGYAPGDALGAVRLSLGRPTRPDDIEIAVADLDAAWRAAGKLAGATPASILHRT